MRVLDRIMVCLYLAFAALPVTAMVRHWKDRSLYGSIPPADPVPLSYASASTDVFQPRLTVWFEQSIGLRNWAIWIDNTLLWHVFDETKWGSLVQIGKRGVLFERDDIVYFNKSGADLPDPREVDKLADRIAALQQRLAREHRALVPIFIPSKTTIFRDAVPDLWTRPFAEPRPSTERVYLAMKRALEARHVVFADGIDLLLQFQGPRDDIWGRDARHFSDYAGCLCVAATLARYAELTGKPAIHYPCEVDRRPAKRSHTELDLFRLANAWGVWRDPVSREVKRPGRPAQPPPGSPSAMWISSSFGWTMMADAFESNQFSRLYLDYYNNTVNSPHEPSFDAKNHDDHWRSVFLPLDLYILELNETYLTPGKFFGADAIDAISAELDAHPVARPPP